MYLIDRAVAVVEIKQPCLDWINYTDGPEFTLETANQESHVYPLGICNTNRYGQYTQKQFIWFRQRLDNAINSAEAKIT